MLHTIEQFNQHAVKLNLSAGAILLWQRLYCTMSRKGQFADVQQHTAVLTAQLNVTRQGLQQMRQSLIDNGFLSIRQDEHQQIFYTLMLNGKIVGEKPAVSDTKNETDYHNHTVAARPSGDIILTNRIRPYIDTFCQTFGNAVKPDLLQWADMRRKNGWTLTLWGLEEMLKKLIALADGDVFKMGQIVAQSVKRRWKGFFALKVKAAPSGEKLIKQEQRQQSYRKPWDKTPLQKFKPEGRDLSFLER